MVDMVTDVQVILEYLNTPGKEAYAYPLMGMVGTCLILQLVLVWLQARKAPKAKMAKEMLIVLSGLKPGFDAYQVAKGAEQSVGAVFDPATELAFTKGVEMIAESIPGCVLQFYVLLTTLKGEDGASTSSITSLLISALSTGYSSATITWDFDTDIPRRRDDSEFYGMIPDGVRGNAVFLCMILNSAMLLLVRSLSYAMLMLVNPAYVLYYALGDTAFFFLQKSARGDFKYFDNVDGLAGLLVFDFLLQFILKTIVDFTGLVQFRGPGVLGGAYWSGSMVCAKLISRHLPPFLTHSIDA
jgi:hypothetical protein